MSAHTSLPSIAVVHPIGDRVAVWHVDIGPDLGLSRLSGAWVLDGEQVDTIAKLLSHRPIAYSVTADRLAGVTPDGGVIDTDATVDLVRTEIDRADRRFSEHQQTVPGKLIRPHWPAVAHPRAAHVHVLPSDEDVRPALTLAHGFKDLADAWAAFESLRSTRPFLSEDAGTDSRPLPLAMHRAEGAATIAHDPAGSAV